MAGHTDKDCVGRWEFTYNDKMAVTLVSCTHCDGSLDQLAAERENELDKAMRDAEFVGRRFVHKRAPVVNRIAPLGLL